ncbi:hypothetical protein RZE82_02350 [Mollicutes bacterium LVI A0039]|nr:hypothetical protein RZE82_02350 [Mollicutes bacterium LVI A0039]
MRNVLNDKLNLGLTKETTKQEKTILVYLKEHELEIEQMTAKMIAEACFCSTSAVNRAVKQLGFEGFTEFKSFAKFSHMIDEQQTQPKDRYTSYINLILDDIDYREVDLFATEINKLDMMYVYGNGVSNISSLFLFRQLLNKGYNTVYIPDLDMLNKLTHGTVICVSSIGTNSYVNKVLRGLDVDLLSITKKGTPQDKLSRLSITHKIDYSNATEIEREQQIQMLLLIGALMDNLEDRLNK